jgi:hypothetical protein
MLFFKQMEMLEQELQAVLDVEEAISTDAGVQLWRFYEMDRGYLLAVTLLRAAHLAADTALVDVLLDSQERLTRFQREALETLPDGQLTANHLIRLVPPEATDILFR